MALPAWFWPPSGQTARGVSLASFGGLLLVPDWTTPTLWPFSPSGGAFLPGLATTVASGLLGFAAAASGFANVLFGGSGLLAVSYAGSAWMGGLPWPPSFTATLPLPSGQVYVGCACASDGQGYVVDSSGHVSVLASGSLASGALGTFPAPAWFLAASGTTLASLLPASGVGLMNTVGGATGLVALPAGMTVPSCLAMTSGALGVGGWATAPSLLGAAAAMLDPQDPLTMAAVGSGFARLWRTPAASGEAWSQAQALSGLAVLNSLSWRPDGTQVLAASPASGVVQVLNYAGGILSLAQTVTVSAACGVAVAGTSTDALVAQSGATHVTPLVYAGGSWATGAAVGFGVSATAVAVAPFGPTGAVVAHTAGITFMSLTTGGWVAGAIQFTTPVTALAVDQFLRVYYAGQGFVIMSSGLVPPLVSGSLPGGFGPSALAVQDGRIAVADTIDGTFYIYGQDTPTTLSQEFSGTLSMGLQPVGLALSATALFTMGSAATVLTGFSGTPFVATPVLSGMAARWNGSAWTTTVLGVGHQPSCCAFDSSGNLQVATVENTLWSIGSGGAGTSGIVQQYAGQTQAVPLSVSALLSSGGHLYAATSLAGTLMELY